MRSSGLLLVFTLSVPPAAAQTPALTPSSQPLGPKTVVPAHVACTDLPISTVPGAPLYIVAPHAGSTHEMSYRDDVVVLSGGTPQGLQPGQRFFARRFQAPRNGEPVSLRDRGSVHTSGWLTVIAADEHSALARVDYACDGVASGDYLEPYDEPTLPATVAPEAPSDFSNLGRVLMGVDRRESFGAGDFLSVDRGSAQGMQTGMRVAFYRDRQSGTPLVELATGVVVEVTAETSKVVLDRARFPVITGDYFAVQEP